LNARRISFSLGDGQLSGGWGHGNADSNGPGAFLDIYVTTPLPSGANLDLGDGRGFDMNEPAKVVAWVCIFSTLFMGCYSSVLIDPTGDEKEKIYSKEIEYVIATAGPKYEFTQPPAIVHDTIVGETTGGREIRIPLSDVGLVCISELNGTHTGILVGLVVVVVVLGVEAARGLRNCSMFEH
jgi:hypothetical protein